jgi:hypothetical protein
MQPLTEIELDGTPVDFEHGMLLLEELTAGERGHWHILLLRVPPAATLTMEDDPEAACAVVARTTRGERVAGSARLRPFRAAHDCLRLVGISPLEWQGA